MFCHQCGNQLADGARFCGQCGAATAFAAPAQAPAAPATPRPPMPPARMPGAAPQTPPPGFQPPVFGAPQAQAAPPMQGPGFQPPMGGQAPWQPPHSPQFQAPPMQPQMAPPGAPPGMPPMGSPMAGGAMPAGMAMAGAYPAPPNLHWAIVLIAGIVTYGLAYYVWGFRQAFFVKKLDAANKAVMYLSLSLAACVVQVVLFFTMARNMGGDAGIVTTMLMLTNVVILALGIAAIFGMRASLLRHYNQIEPIGLKLGGVMTFFFSVLYFQYHFRRIAEWKTTGVLK